MTKKELQQHKQLVHLAVRQLLMKYYKELGSANNLVSIISGLSVTDAPVSTKYIYQRQLREMHNEKIFHVSGADFARMSKNPHLFTILVDPNRSPEMKELVDNIVGSLHDYLPTVTVKIDPVKLGAVDDSKLLSRIKISTESRPSIPRNMEEYVEYLRTVEDTGITSFTQSYRVDMRPSAVWSETSEIADGIFVDDIVEMREVEEPTGSPTPEQVADLLQRNRPF
mgnify:CR=1 FL=1